MPVEHCLLSCVAGWTQCRRSIQRSSSACGPRWDQCRDCPCCPGAAASQTCPIRHEGWSTGKSRSGSCMWLEAKVHRNQFSYTMTPPTPPPLPPSEATDLCHYWHLTLHSQTTGAKAKCLLCCKFRLRITFHHSNLNDIIHSIIQIPKVECSCKSGGEQST